MAEDHPDIPSTTPLDLLINAIAGSTDFDYLASAQDAQEGDSLRSAQHVADSGELHPDGYEERAATPNTLSANPRSGVQRQIRSPSPRQKQLAKTLSTHVIRSFLSASGNAGAAGASNVPQSSSTIEVWHPTTAQKSYGKERRILNPPPILRVTGPLLPSISSATLSSTPYPSQATDNSPSGSQTHRFALSVVEEPIEDADVPSSRSTRPHKLGMKRKWHEAALVAGFGATLSRSRRQTDGRDRERLRNGLAFPALWVGEEAGKRKEFRLELRVGQSVEPQPSGSEQQAPSATATVEESVLPGSTDYTSAEQDTELANVLGTPSIDMLQPLAEAVQHAGAVIDPVLADYTVPAASTLHEATSAVEAKSPVNDPKPSVENTWGTFLSTPLKIVSKPSQKTAKARSMASCFSCDSSFALWTRIHSQTVRTKYMMLETQDGTPRLTSKTGKWTPFRFEVIERASLPQAESKSQRRNFDNSQHDRHDDKLTYGSIVRLVDLQTGIMSDAVKLVKVESNEVRVGENEGHPVSELQRIGLVRIDSDTNGHASRWYLSAPGARLGGGELDHATTGRGGRKSTVLSSKEIALPATLNGVEPDDAVADSTKETNAQQSGKKRRKTKRNALAAAVLAEDEDGGFQTVLSWVKADRIEVPVDVSAVPVPEHEPANGPGLVEKSTIRNYTLTSIRTSASFNYSIFSTTETLDDQTSVPVDPIPRILVPPTFHSNQNTLDLTLSQFHFPTSAASPELEPLDVCLGPLGPLHVTTWRSTAPGGHDGMTAAVPYEASSTVGPSLSKVTSSYPADSEHIIVVVHMPNPEDIIKTMQDCVAEAALDAMVDEHSDQGQASAVNGDMAAAANPSPVDPSSTEEMAAPWFDQASSSIAAPVPGDGGLGDRNDENAAEELAIAAALNMNHPDFPTLHHLESFVAPPVSHTENLPGSQNTSNLALDPTLQDESTNPANRPTVTPILPSLNGDLTGIPHTRPTNEAEVPPPIKLAIPEKQETNHDMMPLPVVLIRRSDGMGFGTGRSVVAQRLDSATATETRSGSGSGEGFDVVGSAARWGLRVIDT